MICVWTDLLFSDMFLDIGPNDIVSDGGDILKCFLDNILDSGKCFGALALCMFLDKVPHRTHCVGRRRF